MGKQLVGFTTEQGTAIPAAYARIIRTALPRLDAETTISQAECQYAIYDSKAKRDANFPPYKTDTVILLATDPLFTQLFGAAPIGQNTLDDLYQKSYQLLMVHPASQATFAGSTDA